jgi:tetratricopeptide (TPR) repeat protein
MPRNFREDAEGRFNQAMDLRKGGKHEESIAILVEALKIYPRLLRALTYLGVSYAETGNPRVGAGILNLAIRYYPQDAGAHFNLAMADGALGQGEEIDEYPESARHRSRLCARLFELGERSLFKAAVRRCGADIPQGHPGESAACFLALQPEPDPRAPEQNAGGEHGESAGRQARS